MMKKEDLLLIDAYITDKWRAEISRADIYIKVSDGVRLPVAQVATPVGNWSAHPEWRNRAVRNAYLLAESPNLLKACKEALLVLDKNTFAYTAVKEAINRVLVAEEVLNFRK